MSIDQDNEYRLKQAEIAFTYGTGSAEFQKLRARVENESNLDLEASILRELDQRRRLIRLGGIVRTFAWGCALIPILLLGFYAIKWGVNADALGKVKVEYENALALKAKQLRAQEHSSGTEIVALRSELESRNALLATAQKKEEELSQRTASLMTELEAARVNLGLVQAENLSLEARMSELAADGPQGQRFQAFAQGVFRHLLTPVFAGYLGDDVGDQIAEPHGANKGLLVLIDAIDRLDMESVGDARCNYVSATIHRVLKDTNSYEKRLSNAASYKEHLISRIAALELEAYRGDKNAPRELATLVTDLRAKAEVEVGQIHEAPKDHQDVDPCLNLRAYYMGRQAAWNLKKLGIHDTNLDEILAAPRLSTGDYHQKKNGKQ